MRTFENKENKYVWKTETRRRNSKRRLLNLKGERHFQNNLCVRCHLIEHNLQTLHLRVLCLKTFMVGFFRTHRLPDQMSLKSLGALNYTITVVCVRTLLLIDPEPPEPPELFSQPSTLSITFAEPPGIAIVNSAIDHHFAPGRKLSRAQSCPQRSKKRKRKKWLRWRCELHGKNQCVDHSLVICYSLFHDRRQTRKPGLGGGNKTNHYINNF